MIRAVAYGGAGAAGSGAAAGARVVPLIKSTTSAPMVRLKTGAAGTALFWVLSQRWRTGDNLVGCTSKRQWLGGTSSEAMPSWLSCKIEMSVCE
jgi:hypothetical protein